ncbi:MAG TPA: hypothetical protein DIW23_07250 [Anaerolineae bacterium]|nr:hypothetical protein [Anaerolineae bacterium]
MPADTKNRKSARSAVATGLAAVLVGSGKPCNEVVGYQKKTIDKSPLVMVLSSGVGRARKAQGTSKYRIHFYLEIQVVLRDTDDSGLTEAQREDKLDDIEKIIADWISDNQSGEHWDLLKYAGDDGREATPTPSRISKAIYDKPCIVEVIQLEVFVND